jgi:hypothetical protein
MDRGGTALRFKIDGCPEMGIAAIDFRRENGLPEQADDITFVPAYAWQDEEFVRRHSSWANQDADILAMDLPHYYSWTATGGEVKQVANRGNSVALGTARLNPGILAAYLKEQTPETGRAVLVDIFAAEARDKEAAETLAAFQREQIAEQQAEAKAAEEKLNAARALLADELDNLKEELSLAHGRIKDMDELIKEYQRRLVRLMSFVPPELQSEACANVNMQEPLPETKRRTRK